MVETIRHYTRISYNDLKMIDIPTILTWLWKRRIIAFYSLLLIYLFIDLATAGTNKTIAESPGIPSKASLGLDDNWVWIPPGTFKSGSPETEKLRSASFAEELITITLTQGFYIGKFEVTQREYIAVIGHNPSFFTDNLNLPVERVNFFEAVEYCSRLTTKEHDSGRLPKEWRYRMPTDAEREYTCRAGTSTAFHFGNHLRSGMANFDGRYEYNAVIGNITNLNGIFLDRTTPVGSYQPNAWGLYDMHGNVQEWTWDRFRTDQRLQSNSYTNPIGTNTQILRSMRGGNFHGTGFEARSGAPGDALPTYRANYLGFRVVLIKEPPSVVSPK